MEAKPLGGETLAVEAEIMAGLIDKEAETARLGKEIEKLQKDLARITGKLNNPKFVDKAPEDVVAKERDKQAAQQQALNKLEQQLQQISAL